MSTPRPQTSETIASHQVPGAVPDSEPLLRVDGLSVEFVDRRGAHLKAVDDVSFTVGPGEILGIIGESGAGKSVTGHAIVSLVDPPGQVAARAITLDGRRIDNLSPADLRNLRGRKIGMIFQDPLTSLDPVMKIGQQLVETLQAHHKLDHRQARQRALDLLQDVGIPGARTRFRQYPHQLSGGLRQRVVIALALAANPRLVIADEPTTALDVSIQAQILRLLEQLCRERQTAVILVTHDMGVVAETADRIAVMYSGRIVEIGPTDEVFAKPRHPYTRGLMDATPRIRSQARPLTRMPGAMPRLDAIPAGCSFHPRCAMAVPDCREVRPKLEKHGHCEVACWRVGETDHA